ncbi:YbhB/YbcL family Raf kinase inhibitor-like protein [Fructilactobacillus cliffordii]|uniref:YbhB/YbcL family Raf kinase inhibitor-like protein n=1 Tax=Fructilactobacillus cliffordii TaxID=2940299 RepID=A0A9Q9E2Z6_9LACO|nr:YbhB/YbcL family Raf kinase inhibitor-like protein [Fructilactobacillus cliffordii]USS89257.1 YbhB/YbcL family Raf kinase inhibitor-like protein [Fructilactobacillus cliffordii]
MKINVPLQAGFLPDQFTKHADASDKIDQHPVVSFPIEFQDVPENAASLALTLIDPDSIPVCGFAYIHWVAANLDSSLTELPTDASQSGKIPMTLGNNSLAGGLLHVTDEQLNRHYIGPTPPDQPHDYHLTVFALDQKLDLPDGFWLNQLEKKMTGHVLAQATTVLPVRN